MSKKLHELIDIWKFGGFMCLYVAFPLIITPIGLILFISIPVIFISMIFDIDLTYLEEMSNLIMIYSVVIMGPYFLGSRWKEYVEKAGIKLNPENN